MQPQFADKVPVDVRVINHFYVSGMGIDRSTNPTLKEFQMVARSKNWIEYCKKDYDEQPDNLSLIALENLDKLKSLY
jgi:hypothetical protein